MSNIAFISVLFLVLIPVEIYLGWINYKGCFKYKLTEGSKLWRWVDRKVGILRLFISPLLDFIIIFVTSVSLVIIGISPETAFISVIVGMLIFRLDDSIYDKQSVEAFEKYCLICNNKGQCNDFLDKNCGIESLKQRVRAAVNLEP